MRFNDVDGLQRESIKDKHIAGSWGNICGLGRRMSRLSGIVILSWFRQWVCDEAVFGRGRQGADGRRVRRCWYGVNETHVANIVEVNLFFEDDRQALAVEAHSQYSGWESELTYYRSPL